MSDQIEKKCFVIMPIGKHNDKSYEYWKSIYEDIIKPAVELADPNIKCYRADDEAKSGQITTDIINNLNNDFMCIADVSGKNANVYYELGLRDSWHNRTIIIAQNFEDVVFDKMDNRAIRYRLDDSKTQSEFNRKMKAAIKDIFDNPNAIRNPVQEYLLKGNVSIANYRGPSTSSAKETKNNIKKSIINLVPVMHWQEWPSEESVKIFDRFYKVGDDGVLTLYLIMNVFHPEDNQQEYISKLVRDFDRLATEMFDIEIENIRNNSSEFFVGSLFSIADFHKVVFVLPYAGVMNDPWKLIGTMKHHFKIVREHAMSSNMLGSNKILNFPVDSKNLSFEIWDLDKVLHLENKYRLTFGKLSAGN